MNLLLDDLRQAARRLRHAPGFTLAAIVTLGLGIGATTTIFSVVNGVLLRPLPYPTSERLVSIRNHTSGPNFADILAWSRSYAAGGGYVSQALDLVGGEEPIQVPAALVTGGLFQALGIDAAIGRTLREADDRAGAARSVVVTHEFWQRRLGGERSALAGTLHLSGQAYTVVGILPRGFALPQLEAEVFAPFHVVFPQAAEARGANMMRTVLRLKPGVTRAAAEQELVLLGRRLQQVDPAENTGRVWALVGLLDHVVGGVRPALLLLLGAVALALLVACLNFANLLLTRSIGRAHELAVRASLGAQRGHLVRQLLTESLLLALAGGALGVMLAAWGVQLLVSLGPESLPRLTSITIDGGVLAFAAALSLVTGLVFGLMPALQASARVEVAEDLKQGAATAVTPRRTGRLLGSLVASQVALALVLLVGTGLLLNGFLRLKGIRPGVDPRHVLTAHIELPEARYPDRASQDRYRDRLLEALTRTPGSEAALVSEVPLGSDMLTHNFLIEGRPPLPVGEAPELFSRSVAGDYFGTLRIPLRAGRGFERTDGAGAAPVGVINESMAREYFAGQNPIGQRVRWSHQEPVSWITIVGVVADIRQFGLDREEQSALYTPYAQFPQDWKRWMNVMVRSEQDPTTLERTLKSTAWTVDPAIPITRIRTMNDVMAASLAQRRFHLLLLGLFGALALALATIGVYGVTAYGVSQRTREIGLRMALGATRPDVVRLVVLGGMRFVFVGLLAGIAGALALTRLLASLLFEVKATDPPTYVVVAAVLTLVALLACVLPASRAARLDPTEALRG